MSPKSLPVTTNRQRTSQSLPRWFAAAVLAVFLLCSTGGRASDTNQFVRLAISPSGGTPAKIVTADFNRDGKADVVALNSNNVLSILLGNGNGTFAAAKTIATLPASAGFPALMVAGDFNGDGNQDLLVVSSPGNSVKVFLGHGDGTFAGAVSIADGLPSAGDLAVGDFNGDGRSDVALASATSVSILLGKSSGIFATPIVTATKLSAPSSLALALGDVNRDSHLDVAVTDSNGDFQVLLGTGTGSFQLETAFNYCAGPVCGTTIAIGDFNGDGDPDIATGSPADLEHYYLGQVCLINGYGDGTFNLNGSCSSAPDSFASTLVANLNGKPDLLFASDPMMVQLNNGAGGLTPTNYAAGGATMALGNFYSDGRQAVAIGTTGGVQVVRNLGSGVFRAPPSITRVGDPFNVTYAINGTDFNGDGYGDLALLTAWDEHSYLETGTITLLGGPKNTFTTGSGGVGFISDGPFVAGPPAIGDFNHDGHLDVALGAIETTPFAQVAFGDGKGNFPTAGPALDLNTNFIAAGDFNGDGKADLASLDGSTFQVLIGQGDGTFAPPVTYGVGLNPVFVLQHDLNGDGKKDLIVVNQGSNDISVLLGNGNGTFQAQKTYATGKSPVAAAVGDFNHDGKIDIAVATSAGVSVLLGNGNGTYQLQKTYTSTGPMTGIVEADFRQDGIEDLIGINSATQRFVLLPGVGDGTFGVPVGYPLDRNPIGIVAGDFNHDGAPDIVILGAPAEVQGDGGLAIFYNQGGDHVTLTSNTSAPVAIEPITFTANVTPSYDEFGTPSGKVTFMNGTTILGTAYLSGGKASITTHFSSGVYKITAEYAGDTSFNPNPSSTLTMVVEP